MKNEAVDKKLKAYGFTSVTHAFDQAVEHLRKRKNGEIKPLKCKWGRLNEVIGGGVQPSTIYTIGGRPGTGKSAFINEWALDICKLNDMSNTVFCYWTWEMPAYQQLIRGFSGQYGKTVMELNSAYEPLSDELFDHILRSRSTWGTYPMYFMSYSVTAEYAFKILVDIQGIDPGLHIVNIFDHTRLSKKAKGMYSEEEKITRLYQAAQQLSVNYGMTNIFLSQLNREIESESRKKLPIPKLSDFFGADSVAQFSNVAFILNQPRQYNLDTYMNENTINLLALHILKNRDGRVGGWIPFDHNLAHNTMRERYPIMETPTYSM